jgi:hypothetical protein
MQIIVRQFHDWVNNQLARAVIRHSSTALGWDDFNAELPEIVRGYTQVFVSACATKRDDRRVLDEEQRIAHVTPTAGVSHELHETQCMAVGDSPHTNEMDQLTLRHAQAPNPDKKVFKT